MEQPHDDAVHILLDYTRTLCGDQVVPGRRYVRLYAPRPTIWDGCWTCLEEANKRFPLDDD